MPCHPPPGLDFSPISQAWSAIRRYYVDRSAIQPGTLTYGAIGGMVDALGDTGHSAFLTPDMTKQLGVIVSGRLEGIGVEIRMKNRQVVIVTAIDDSPAQHAGLRSGDIIMNVDDWDITGRPLDKVVERISGPVGSPVTLELLDSRTHRLRSVTVIRAVIKIAHVTWQRPPGTEVDDLRIASFDGDVVGELRTALRDLQMQGLRGLILDLRNNPGGVLDEAIGAASPSRAAGTIGPAPIWGCGSNVRRAALEPREVREFAGVIASQESARFDHRVRCGFLRRAPLT